MEQMSPQPGQSSFASTGHSTLTRQATYTTAGTIYNPSSAQPLQPPARRGRSFKWAGAGGQSELALLPRSFINSLTLKTINGRSSIYSTVQQYSPLQQNYDRAMSPMSSRSEQCLADMSSHNPRMQFGSASSSPLPSVSPSGQTAKSFTECNSDDDEGDNDDELMKMLMSNMTVKSLHNLASYPNPSQKKARKVLLRGAKSRLGLTTPQPYGTTAGSDTDSSSFQLFSTLRPRSENSFRVVGSSRHTQGEPPLCRSSADGASTSENLQTRGTPTPGISLYSPSPRVTISENLLLALPSTLSAGPGAPRPLTAGPPGQRQYRPSTFDSTFRALQTPSQQHKKSEDDDMLSVAQHTLSQAGIEDIAVTADVLLSNYDTDSYETYSQLCRNTQELATNYGVAGRHGSVGPVGGASNGHYEYKLIDDMQMPISEQTQSEWAKHNRLFPGHWRDPSPDSRARLLRGTDRLVDQEREVRDGKIDKWWRSGTEMVARKIGEIVRDNRKGRHSLFGAIRDGRPHKRDAVTNTPSPMTVAEANRLQTWKHSEPLLEMALATLTVQIEEMSKPKPSRPTPHTRMSSSAGSVGDKPKSLAQSD